MIRAAGLFVMGLACLVLGLGIALLQAENHRQADRLQAMERENEDREVTNAVLDAELLRQLQGIEHGLAEHARTPVEEGLQ